MEHDLAEGVVLVWLVILAGVTVIYLFGWGRNYETQLIEWMGSAKHSFIAAIVLTLMLF